MPSIAQPAITRCAATGQTAAVPTRLVWLAWPGLLQATRGVFVNIALQEPFGLTVIEAAAHGVPTVATKNGGPVDILATLHHGAAGGPAGGPCG